jgi:hypothetical protein
MRKSIPSKQKRIMLLTHMNSPLKYFVLVLIIVLLVLGSWYLWQHFSSNNKFVIEECPISDCKSWTQNNLTLSECEAIGGRGVIDYYEYDSYGGHVKRYHSPGTLGYIIGMPSFVKGAICQNKTAVSPDILILSVDGNMVEVVLQGIVEPGGKQDCPRDGICSIIVSGYEVVIAEGDREGPVGSIESVHVKDQVEVYGILESESTITLYGNLNYYILEKTDFSEDKIKIKQCTMRDGIVMIADDDWRTKPRGENIIAQISDMAIMAWCVLPCASDDTCCHESLKAGQRKDNYLLYGRLISECEKGYSKKMLQCPTTLEWCEPVVKNNI